MLTAQLLITAALASGAVNLEVSPLSGPAVQGALQSIDTQQLVLETAEGPRSFSLTELRRAAVVEGPGARPEGPLITVELVDGSRLQCRKFTVQDGQARLEPHRGPALVASVRALKWVLLAPVDNDPQLQQQWELLLQRKSEGDRIAFARNRDDNNVSLEHLDGTLLNVGQESADFKLEGEDRVASVNRERLTGLIYLQRTGPKLPETICTVSLTDGSVVEAVDLTLEGEQLTVVTPSAVKLAVPSESISAFDFASSNVTYLSDLEPASIECEPFFGVTLDSELQRRLPRQDVDFRGQPLKLPGRPAEAKGLALRSKTLIVYRLQKPYQRFQAVVGIAEHLQGAEITPHLKLVISSNNKQLLEQEITGEDDPLVLDLDVTGAQRLSILVDYGDGQDIADELLLCNARLVK